MSQAFPTITAVDWLKASEVLGGEASDFTPWLEQPDNLQILGNALKLDELTATAREHNVAGLRLDILASAFDEDGEELPVCIENQYGATDGGHLGRLIAYLAQHERGRAVWVVEEATDAFVAAVRFLNRTSTNAAGYYLVQVKFTHGAKGGYQVHFEVLAAPSAWEREPSPGGSPKPLNMTKVTYLNAVMEGVAPRLKAAGYPNFNTHRRGAYLWVAWPPGLWWRRFGRRLIIRAVQHAARMSVYSRELGSRTRNRAAMEILREHIGKKLDASVPAGTIVKWNAAGKGVTEAVWFEREGLGYDGGDPKEMVEWAGALAELWAQLLSKSPIPDLEQQVDARVAPLEVEVEDEDAEAMDEEV